MSIRSDRKYTLELVAFVAGASVMTLELAGSRVLAPYVGTTLGVWTALIGIILASLGLGYALGGRLSDRAPHGRALELILYLAGLTVGLTAVLKDWVLTALGGWFGDVRLCAVVASLLLFAVPSCLLAMVVPYVVRLRIQTVERSGSTVGSLYSVSTFGSIAGTFAAGFWLIPHLGNTRLLLLLSAVLVTTSLLARWSRWGAVKALTLAALLALQVAVRIEERSARDAGVVDVDTAYGRVRVFETDRLYGERTRVMSISGEISSVVSLEHEGKLYGYVRYFDLYHHFAPRTRKLLMIGGAGYSYATHLLRREPAIKIEVVEIDPAVTRLAREHFGLETDDRRLKITHQDGRVFLNRTEKHFGAIVLDAFSALHTVPFQLTTVEAVRAMHRSLKQQGVVVLNLNSAVAGREGRFLRAVHRTFREVFPHVLLFWVETPDSTAHQNLILVAVKGRLPRSANRLPHLAALLRTRWRDPIAEDVPVLTDDRAPVERYVSARRPPALVPGA